MKFLDKIKRGLAKFYYGRYGFDQLSVFLMILSFIFVNIRYIWMVSYLFSIIAIWRSLSKNISKRKVEGDWFNKNIWFKIKKQYFKIKRYFALRKGYILFKCKKCKKQLRIPRHKGTIKITCPECKNVIIKKT